VTGQVHAPATFFSVDRCSVRLVTRGWVGRRVGFVVLGRRKCFMRKNSEYCW